MNNGNLESNQRRCYASQQKPARRWPARLIWPIILILTLSLLGCGRTDPADGGSTSASGGGEQRAIQNKGSDTLVNIALAWAETYRQIEPDVSIAVTGGGSGTGIAALINGTVDIANASRAMKDKEIEAAQENGIEPFEIVVAIDALAVIVHPDNPIEGLTLQQLAELYTGRITNWKEVGGNDAPVVLLSRETNSGTHVYFLEEAVRLGEKENKDIFAPETLLMPSSVGITSELRRNPNAIGYDGLGYVDPAHEKIVPIAREDGLPYIEPSVETAINGQYPLARNLYMYTAGEPTGDVATYLEWIKSATGQEIVSRLGFVPLESNE